MTKRRERPRRFPQRMCVACRTRGDKKSLLRVVRTPEGQIEVDPTGRSPGRGAYLCPNRACWEQALKKRSLNRALRSVLTAEEVTRLRQHAQTLPASPEEDAAAPVSHVKAPAQGEGME